MLDCGLWLTNGRREDARLRLSAPITQWQRSQYIAIIGEDRGPAADCICSRLGLSHPTVPYYHDPLDLCVGNVLTLCDPRRVPLALTTALPVTDTPARYRHSYIYLFITIQFTNVGINPTIYLYL